MSRSRAGVTRTRWRQLVAAVIDAIVRTGFDNARLGTSGSTATGFSVFTLAEKQRIAKLCSRDPALALADTGVLLGLLIGGLRRMVEMVITTLLVNLSGQPFLAQFIAKLIVNWLFRYLKPLAVTAERAQNFGLVFLAFDGRIDDYPDLPGKLTKWGEGRTVAQIQNILGVSPNADQERTTNSAPAVSPGSDSASRSSRDRAASQTTRRVNRALDEVVRLKTAGRPQRSHHQKPPRTGLMHEHVDKQPASPAHHGRAVNQKKSEHETSELCDPALRPTTGHKEPSDKKPPTPAEEARRRPRPQTYTTATNTDPEAAEPADCSQLAARSIKQPRPQEPDYEQDFNPRDWRIILAEMAKAKIEQLPLFLNEEHPGHFEADSEPANISFEQLPPIINRFPYDDLPKLESSTSATTSPIGHLSDDLLDVLDAYPQCPQSPQDPDGSLNPRSRQEFSNNSPFGTISDYEPQSDQLPPPDSASQPSDDPMATPQALLSVVEPMRRRRRYNN